MNIRALMSFFLSVPLLFQTPSATAQQLDQALSQAYLESIARFAAKYAAAARNRDHATVLQLSCLQLGIAIQYIDPDAYTEVAKKSDIVALRTRSLRLHQELKEQGYCE